MQLTNEYHLPQAVVDAISHDTYERGDADYTVTQLTSPPQIQYLMAKHKDEIVEDASDRLWALYGQSMHDIIERAAKQRQNAIAERRFTATVEFEWDFDAPRERVISGQVDLIEIEPSEPQNFARLTDFKNTSVFAVKGGLKNEWVEQINYLAYLAREDPESEVEIDAAQILAFARDWRKAEAQRDPSYPPVPTVVMPVPLWDEQMQSDIIIDRLWDLEWAFETGNPRKCTDDERWAREGGYAVHVKGRKRAKRIGFDSEQEAHKWAYNNLGPKDYKSHYIEYRRPRYVRCEDFCPVAAWCDQWQSELQEGDDVF